MIRTIVSVLLGCTASAALLAGADVRPSFDCSRAEGSVEELICADAGLAALDVRLAAVWKRAMQLSRDNVDLPTIRAEQRGWIKGRNDCWKSDDVRRCTEDSYKQRIAEIEARWRLVEPTGPVFFVCEGNPANELVATFFDTDPPTAVLERGDSTVIAYLAPTGSGAKYEGPNVTFWTKGAEATVTWGYGTDPMTCVDRAANRD